MNLETNVTPWADFFALNTVGALKRFCGALDLSVAEQAALAYYISTWPELPVCGDDEAFVPTAKLSPDRSAIMYGTAPVIFEGTNLWSWKPHFSVEQLSQKLSGLENLVGSIKQSNPDARMTLVLIPEKDYIISRFLLKEGRFQKFDAAVEAFGTRMSAMGISLIFSQPFRDIGSFRTLSDFEYSDSHLAGQEYVSLFGFTLESLGTRWDMVKSAVTLKKLPEFGDLAPKFTNSRPVQATALQPDFQDGKVNLTAGTETFADPLGDTWQEFRNDAPIVDQSVCLLGDSHCSIYSQRKLNYLFANTYRETRFEWNPCGIRKMPDVASYDNVVLEISSRFAV